MSLSFSAGNNRMDSESGMYNFDASGNLLSDGHHTYFFDAENRLIQVDGTAGYCSTGSGAAATACYVYNASGQRVRKTTASGSVDYLYDLAGEQITELSSAGAWNRGEVHAGSRHLATYSAGTSGNTFLIFSDWLGTERVRTTAAGVNCETITNQPFGDAQTISGNCGDPSPLHFTGKERDAESGLDNFGARYNSSQMGRFMSPDPLGGSLIDPQTLNKYSYVRNNPVTLTDPTGLYTCADDQNKCQTKQDIAFEKARQQDLQSKNSDVVRAASAYGDPTKNNGVNVGFADLSSKGENGNTVSTIGTDANGNLRADSNVTINSKATGADLDAAVGHEGSHVADAQDVVRSGLTEDGQKIYAGENITPYTSEQRAYGVTNSILSSENESRNFFCGMSTCTLGRGVMLGSLPSIIDQILSSNSIYNIGGKPMSSTNQGQPVVNGVSQTPRATVPH